jgi:REP element-mobilizing transposase RayT
MHNSHSSFDIAFHLVLVTKYRQNFPFLECISWKRIIEVYNKNEFSLVSYGSATNHIHILLNINKTSFDVAKFVNFIKSESSFRFRYEYRSLWPGWQNGYYVCSVGKKSVKKVRKYISSQS